MRAVITAGGKIDGAYAERAGTPIKALARVRGETMLRRAIYAARDAGASAIAVVGGKDARGACEGDVDAVVPESASGAENVHRALHAWPDDEALLYLTSDMPYISGDAVADFVKRAGDNLAIALCSHDDYLRRFPGAHEAGIRLGREYVVNGGAFFIPAGAARRVADRAARLFDARKSPCAMARVAGIDLLLRFASGTLSITALERRAAKVLGIGVQAVRNCAPELAFDADELADYLYAREHH